MLSTTVKNLNKSNSLPCVDFISISSSSFSDDKTSTVSCSEIIQVSNEI